MPRAGARWRAAPAARAGRAPGRDLGTADPRRAGGRAAEIGRSDARAESAKIKRSPREGPGTGAGGSDRVAPRAAAPMSGGGGGAASGVGAGGQGGRSAIGAGAGAEGGTAFGGTVVGTVFVTAGGIAREARMRRGGARTAGVGAGAGALSGRILCERISCGAARRGALPQCPPLLVLVCTLSSVHVWVGTTQDG